MQNHMAEMQRMRKQLSAVLEAAQALVGGLSDPDRKYYLERIDRWLDYGMKATGLPIGSRAHLIDDVLCEGGWKGEELNLARGKAGTVEDLDILEDGTLRVLFTPDNQVWVPSETYTAQGITKGVPKPKDRPACFWIKASHLRPGGTA